MSRTFYWRICVLQFSLNNAMKRLNNIFKGHINCKFAIWQVYGNKLMHFLDDLYCYIITQKFLLPCNSWQLKKSKMKTSLFRNVLFLINWCSCSKYCCYESIYNRSWGVTRNTSKHNACHSRSGISFQGNTVIVKIQFQQQNWLICI